MHFVATFISEHIYWLYDSKVWCNILEVSVSDSPGMWNVFISKNRNQRFLECLLSDFIILFQSYAYETEKVKLHLNSSNTVNSPWWQTFQNEKRL
jgi:hypothetical protein